jgi:hypothetical protein
VDRRARAERGLRSCRDAASAEGIAPTPQLLIDELSSTLVSIDYTAASTAEFEWLVDRDDWPVMQTALAADATVFVTDNSVDFPLGESRNGVLILGAETFLNVFYGRFEDAQTTVEEYLAGAR